MENFNLPDDGCLVSSRNATYCGIVGNHDGKFDYNKIDV